MKIRLLLCTLALALLTAACATGGPGASAPVITEDTLLNIKNGQSTREDVTGLLGKPIRTFNFTARHDEVLEYRYTRGSWLMLLSVHIDTRSGKVSSVFSEPDPKIYQPNDH